MKNKNNRFPNYDFSEKKEPKKRMGNGQFSNMPNKPIHLKFADSHDYRSGVINSFTTNLQEISGIEENGI